MTKDCIVCVDDDIAVLNSLKQQLKRFYQNKYLLEFADNPQEAIEIIKDLVAKKYVIPVIISDYIMAGMNGDEFFAAIQNIAQAANKILLSGQADLNGIIHSINKSHLYAFIPKPWEEGDLFLTINAALEKYDKEQLLKISNEQLKTTNEEISLLNKKLKAKNAILAKFVPQRIIENVLTSNEEHIVTLGECLRENMNVIFCDIRNSTYISEELGVEDCFNFLNEYHGFVSPIIMQHGGIVDNFMGDGVLSLFRDSAKALQAAVEIQKGISCLQPWCDKLPLDKIETGIGISYGEVMIGTVGTESRMQTTVIGDTVNVASRLEGLNKKYGYCAILSQAVLDNLENRDILSNCRFDQIGNITVKGKKSKMSIFGLTVI